MTRLAAIVRERALKNSPVTPERKARGAKIMTVDAEEPRSGLASSRAASSPFPRAASLLYRRMMCSTITTVSSMMRPTAAAIPPRVIMLRLICSA